MDNFSLFICGLVVALISGMGVITSEVFLAYTEHVLTEKRRIERLIRTSRDNQNETAKQSV